MAVSFGPLLRPFKSVCVSVCVCVCVCVFQTVTGVTGALGVAGPVAVRTGPSVSLCPGRAAASQGSSDATVRTPARSGPTARAACTSACVEMEGHVTKPLENVFVGTASLEHSEYTFGSPSYHGNRFTLVTIATPSFQ